ncbi:MAG: HAMP domain-containing sensor histidine kinase [Chloroflexota bacterium]|nr:HAMP domain-containing sensor histidine kinase [Chloroflexota bacterium]
MSLRLRLVLSHALIVVLCLCIVAGAVLILLQQYRVRFAVARLDDMTIPIYIQARSLARGQASLDEVWNNLVDQAQETGVLVFLVDEEGNVVRKETPSSGAWANIQTLPLQEQTEDASQPYHGTYRLPRRGTLVYAAYPLASLFNSQSPTIPSTLVLAMPLTGALALWAGFAQPFVWAGLIALAISAVLAIVLARSVYRPIRRVTDAADRMARGQYGQAVPLTGPPEMKRLAQAFNQMASQVRRSQQRLRDFVADVSHELRSPLTAIRGFAEAMVDGTARDGEAKTRSAQVIHDESVRMMRLVDDLLELSRIESGQIQMSLEPVDIPGLVLHCAELFAMRAQEKGIALSTETPQVPPVLGDIDRLEQVFSNLLDNALKHTPEGGDVRVLVRSPSPHVVEVAVTDTGPGIPQEVSPHLFERFYQADATSRQTGTGLGLAIAREVARAHGGDIQARNAVGGGAEFVVRLPTTSL